MIQLQNIKKFFKLISYKLKIFMLLSLILGVIKSFIVFFGLAIIVPVAEIIAFNKTSINVLQEFINNYNILDKINNTQIAIFLIIYLVIIQIFTISYDYFFVSKLTNKINNNIVIRFFSNFIKSDLKFSNSFSYADYITMINIDIRRSVNGVIKTIIYTFVNGFFLLFFVFFTIYFLKINLIEFFILFLFLIFIFYFLATASLKKVMQNIGYNISTEMSKRERVVRDLYDSLKSIKFYRNLKFFIFNLKEKSKKIYKSFAYEENITQLPGKILEIIIYSSFIIILIFANRKFNKRFS